MNRTPRRRIAFLTAVTAFAESSTIGGEFFAQTIPWDQGGRSLYPRSLAEIVGHGSNWSNRSN